MTKKKKDIDQKQSDQARTYVERYEARLQPPKFKAKYSKDSGITVDLDAKPGDAYNAVLAAIQDASGMADYELGSHLIGQAAVYYQKQSPESFQTAMNRVSSLMLEMKPQDAFEGLLIAQMAATHNQAMDCLSRAEQTATVAHREMYLRFADRFLRTYTIQMEALSKHRRGGQQKVVVEHVHVHEGGQAFVGNIENHRGGGGDANKK